jgi:hypothetical protein
LLYHATKQNYTHLQNSNASPALAAKTMDISYILPQENKSIEISLQNKSEIAISRTMRCFCSQVALQQNDSKVKEYAFGKGQT